MNHYQYYQCKMRDRACTKCGEAQGGAPQMACEGGYPLAMVYSPVQCFRNLYDPEGALESGTLFKELYLPILTAGGNGR